MKDRIIVFGPPASGKGTQADSLSRRFGIPHVSTGALLRSETERGSDLGKEADSFTRTGGLVPDELILRIVMSWIVANGPRFLFDGFPRTVEQARRLDAFLENHDAPVELVVMLELSEEEIRRRVLRRLTCRACGSTFSSNLHGLREGSACLRCASPLVRRADDSESAIVERLRVYRELTLPVAAYYGETRPGIIRRVDADRPEELILEEISRSVRGGG